jgi:hypothetical protein
VHCSDEPEPVVEKPALHVQVAALLPLVLAAGHPVQKPASALLNEPGVHARQLAPVGL